MLKLVSRSSLQLCVPVFRRLPRSASFGLGKRKLADMKAALEKEEAREGKRIARATAVNEIVLRFDYSESFTNTELVDQVRKRGKRGLQNAPKTRLLSVISDFDKARTKEELDEICAERGIVRNVQNDRVLWLLAALKKQDKKDNES